MSLLHLDDVNAFYGRAQALHGVSLEVDEGEIIGIIGANGAGKSTLLDSIMGLVTCTGTISFNAQNIAGATPADIVRLGIGYAPERANLFPYMSVRDNLLVGAYTARDKIQNSLDRVHNLFPVLAERHKQETGTQSGGERQMVAIGRALMTDPKLLLVDEPTIGLAPKVCADIAAALKKLNAETGLTLIITEQNVNFALTLASRLYVLDTGRIRTSGTPEDLARDPALNAAYFGH